ATRAERESFASSDVNCEFVRVNRPDLSVAALRVCGDDSEPVSDVVFEHSGLLLLGSEVGGVEERQPARQLAPDRDARSGVVVRAQHGVDLEAVQSEKPLSLAPESF